MEEIPEEELIPLPSPQSGPEPEAIPANGHGGQPGPLVKTEP